MTLIGAGYTNASIFCVEDGDHFLPAIILDKRNRKAWVAQLKKAKHKRPHP